MAEILKTVEPSYRFSAIMAQRIEALGRVCRDRD